MTDDENESSGVPRRHFFYLLTPPIVATAGAGAWGWPYFREILGGRNEPGNFREDTEEPAEPDVDPDNGYSTWQDAVPEGCDISAYEDDIEAYVRDDLGMEDDLTGYVNSGRIEFRAESDGELLLLADTNASGQYDTDDYLPDVCG